MNTSNKWVRLVCAIAAGTSIIMAGSMIVMICHMILCAFICDVNHIPRDLTRNGPSSLSLIMIAAITVCAVFESLCVYNGQDTEKIIRGDS
jgi:hypothetical protein